MSSTVIESRVSVAAIRRANEKRRGRKYMPTESTSRNGEIHVRFSSGLGFKQITITKDQISSAYRKALQKNGKKL